MTDKKNHLVSKDNDLIEAKYRLTVQEQRLLAIMISDIKPEDIDFKKYRYKISDILKWLQIDDKGYYQKLRAITRKLISRGITISNKQENTIFQTSWLAGAKYYIKKGYIDLTFHPDLKPYLLQLQSCFTQYALQNVLELKSKYAFRLYELCKQYQNIGKRKFQIDELRELLGLEKGELKKWSAFKERVLNIAQREINKHTDIKIKYEFEKWARKFEYITVYISANSEKEIEEERRKNERFHTLINLIKNEKDRKKKTILTAIIKYLKKKGYKYVERNILYANEKAEKNYRNFLIQSLRNDWAMAWYEDLQEEQEKAIEAQKKREKEEKFREWVKIQRKKAEERAKEQLSAMPPDEYKKKFDETKKRMSGILSNLDDSIVVGAMVYEKVKEMVDQLVREGKMKQSIGEEILKANTQD